MENSIRLFKHLRHFFKKGKGEKLPMVSHQSNITFNIFNILVLSFSLFLNAGFLLVFLLQNRACILHMLMEVSNLPVIVLKDCFTFSTK